MLVNTESFSHVSESDPKENAYPNEVTRFFHASGSDPFEVSIMHGKQDFSHASGSDPLVFAYNFLNTKSFPA